MDLHLPCTALLSIFNRMYSGCADTWEEQNHLASVIFVAKSQEKNKIGQSGDEDIWGQEKK